MKCPYCERRVHFRTFLVSGREYKCQFCGKKSHTSLVRTIPFALVLYGVLQVSQSFFAQRGMSPPVSWLFAIGIGLVVFTTAEYFFGTLKKPLR